MIRERGKSLKHRLPSMTRVFLLLLVSSAVLTYIVYESASRKNRFSKVTQLDGSLERTGSKSRTLTGDRILSKQSQRALIQPKLEHVRVALKISSDFKTTPNPSLTSVEEEQISSILRKAKSREDEKAAYGLVRGQKSSYNEENLTWDVDKRGNDAMSSAAKIQGDRKPLMNFANQGEEDSNDDSEPDEEEGRKRLPNAIIVGAKKGGTRAILEMLKIHPDVRACGSEVHFFDRDENYSQGLEWYRQQMPPSLPGQITLEKSPSYFVTSKVPERVYRMSKDVKLITIVRDPTERAVSDYTQSLDKKPHNPPFEEMVLDDNGEIVENWSKLAIGRYAEHLSRWLKYFPLNQFHFVSGEELIRRPAKEIRLVEKFLNLKPFIKEKNFYFNDSKGFPCFIGKIRHSGSVSETHCLSETKGRKHPPVRQDVLKRIQEYFRPLNEKFYLMVGRNFHWP